MVDLTNEEFFARLFDKYNLTTIDVDANFERGYEFEPLASFNELMGFLHTRPDRFTKDSSGKSSQDNYKLSTQPTDKLEPVRDYLIHLVQEDYEENKQSIAYRMKGKHEGTISESSIRNRNLQRMRHSRDHAERKAKQAKDIIQEIDDKEREKMLHEARANEDKVYRTLNKLIKANNLEYSDREHDGPRQNMYEHRVMRLPITKIGKLM